MTDETETFGAVWKILQPYDGYLEHIEILASAYNLDAIQVKNEFEKVRDTINLRGLSFPDFSSLAQYVLTNFEYPTV